MDRIAGIVEPGGFQHFAEVQQASRCRAGLSVHFRVDRKEVVAGLFDCRDEVANRLDDRDRDNDVVAFRFDRADAQNFAVDVMPRQTRNVAVSKARVTHEGTDARPILADAPGGLHDALLVGVGECLAGLAVDVLGPQRRPRVANAG